MGRDAAVIPSPVRSGKAEVWPESLHIAGTREVKRAERRFELSTAPGGGAQAFSEPFQQDGEHPGEDRRGMVEGAVEAGNLDWLAREPRGQIQERLARTGVGLDRDEGLVEAGGIAVRDRGQGVEHAQLTTKVAERRERIDSHDARAVGDHVISRMGCLPELTADIKSQLGELAIGDC